MQWISINDQLPELDLPILCINQFHEIQVCSFVKNRLDEEPIWMIHGMILFYPTHWMPLPEPPKE